MHSIPIYVRLWCVHSEVTVNWVFLLSWSPSVNIRQTAGFTVTFRVEKTLTLHIANHAWAWPGLWNNPASACCPTHLGPAQWGTRFVSHTLALEEAARDTARYDHPWEAQTHTHTQRHKAKRTWVTQLWRINESNPPKCILTDTRRVSGWSLAVRGDRAGQAIIS